jgi:hypothetical protein
MKTHARTHPDDEVADDKCDHLNPVNRVGPKPENTGDRPSERKADQEGIVDPLLESSTARNNAAGLSYCDGQAGPRDSQFKRSTSL